MTQFTETIIIIGMIISAICLLILILSRLTLTVTTVSRPMTEEEIKEIKKRKWFKKLKAKVDEVSESTESSHQVETAPKHIEAVRQYAAKEQTAINTLLDTISKDAGIDSKCSLYRKRFLRCKRTPNRSRVYIEKENLELIKSLLQVIDPKATISGFVSNIVADHLDRYKPEIIKMYNDERTKIL